MCNDSDYKVFTAKLCSASDLIRQVARGHRLQLQHDLSEESLEETLYLEAIANNLERVITKRLNQEKTPFKDGDLGGR